MLIILFNLIWFLNLGVVILKKQNKFIAVISFLFAVFSFFYNTRSNDYNMYAAIYDLKNTSEVEIGFEALIRLARLMGLSFNQFQGLIGLTCLSINLWIFGKYSQNYNLFFSLYFISQFFTDINLLRNCIMRTLVLMAFYYLINSKKINAIIVLIVAITIHRAAFFYLLFVLYDINTDGIFGGGVRFNKKMVVKYAAAIGMYICVVNYILGNKWLLLRSIAKIYLGEKSEKFDYYFSTMTRFGFMIYFVLFALYFFIIYFTQDRVAHYKFYKFNDFSKLVYYVNWFVILSFPMIMINLDFHRLANGIYFINIIFFSILIEANKKSEKYYIWLIILVFCNYLWRLPIVQGWDQKYLILAG